ncbi:MAG: sterol desaturase family protein [Betaproteobacteria bacterium]|nr:MAG: sterol desaturase family protein [Betaproteobacteria bacterium]
MNGYALIVVLGAALLAIERLRPGRALPATKGWFARAAALNAAQLGIVVLGGHTWSVWLQGPSLLHIDAQLPAIAQGFLCWFVGTFVFYWWHRARHAFDMLWRLHQVHHSASRIETLTSFYKHPLEIAINSILSSTIIFVFLGASVEAVGWYSVFAALGEFYYHMNVKTPRWTGYFLQRPEQHSIHHQLDVHYYNFGDITWWDRLFGTFKETDRFTAQCGYHPGREQRLAQMLVFQDVNK